MNYDLLCHYNFEAIESYVKVESLDGYYEYDGYTKLKNLQSGHNYSIG